MHRNDTALFSERTGILHSGDKSIQLTNQCAACLALLLQNVGEFVTKEHILDKCWHSRGVMVSEVSVRQTLFILRKNIHDAGLDPHCLTSVQRKGYKLLPGWIKFAEMDGSYVAEMLLAEAAESAPEDRSVPEFIPESASVVVEKNYLLPRIVSWFHGKYFFLHILSLTMTLSVCAFFYQNNRAVTPVEYRFFEKINGAEIFIQSDADIKEDLTRSALLWLSANGYISLHINKYVYVNRVFSRNFLSAFVCNRPVNDKKSTCYSLILEDRR